MKLIIGLGNPGKKYSGTRHNAGRILLERIAVAQAKTWKVQQAFKSLTAELNWEGQTVLLVCPETFMNLSGEAVRAVVQYFKVDTARDLLIAVDDTAIPLGTLRLRISGSDGGHNGLKSIQTCLETQDYPRLRIGIGAPEGSISLEDYVLQNFAEGEKNLLEDALGRGVEACHLWLTQPADRVMNAVNASNEKG